MEDPRAEVDEHGYALITGECKKCGTTKKSRSAGIEWKDLREEKSTGSGLFPLTPSAHKRAFDQTLARTRRDTTRVKPRRDESGKFLSGPSRSYRTPGDFDP